MIIDFHTHILPGIDDGSKSIEMSLEMLQEEQAQGIGAVVASPHFYADSMTIERFLSAREKSFKKLSEGMQSAFPKIICGAEVLLFPGIDTADGVEALCIENTRAMLIEMPMKQWSDWEVRVFRNLLTRGIIPVIAHIDRYLKVQKKKAALEEILSLPLYVQVNADSIISRRERRPLLRMFDGGYAQLLGSDCHNTGDRSVNLKQAREIIADRLGEEQLDLIDGSGSELLKL